MNFLPSYFEVIPKGINDKYLEEHKVDEILFEWNQGSLELYFHFLNERENYLIEAFIEWFPAYLSFPYKEMDEVDIKQQIYSEIMIRLSKMIKYLIHIENNFIAHYIEKLIYDQINYLNSINFDIKYLNEEDLTRRNIGLKVNLGSQAIIVFDLKDTPLSLLKLENIKIIEEHKYQYFFLKELGIIDLLEKNWRVLDNADQQVNFDSNQLAFARLLAKITGMDDPNPMRECLKDDRSKGSGYFTSKAKKAVEGIFRELRISKIEP